MCYGSQMVLAALVLGVPRTEDDQPPFEHLGQDDRPNVVRPNAAMINFGAHPLSKVRDGHQLELGLGELLGRLWHAGDHQHVVRTGQRVGDDPGRQLRGVAIGLP